MVDYGMVQDNSLSFEQLYKLNGRNIPLDFSTLDYIVCTHENADHVSALPRIPSFEDFNGQILMTSLCAELTRINLEDGAHLHNKEIEAYNKHRKNKSKELSPLFNSKSVDQVMSIIQGYSFNREIIINDNITLEFLPAGHIPGAAMILITVKEKYNVKRVLFTGDTSGMKRDIPFTMKPNLKKRKINYVISESTYGNRLIPKTNIEKELIKHVKETCIDNKKKMLIPVFSISRSTNMLHYLKKVYEKNPEFKKIKIYFASPMACKCHKIIGQESSFEFYDNQWHKYKDLWSWADVEYIETFKHLLKTLGSNEPCIYLASSGMCTGGYSNYLMTQFLSKSRNKLLFCGYQGIATNGRRLVDGEQKSITVTEDGRKQKLLIRADVDMINGMSSHCDYQDLIYMFNTLEKKKIEKFLLIHGDNEAIAHFQGELIKSFSNTDVLVPKYKNKIKLC